MFVYMREDGLPSESLSEGQFSWSARWGLRIGQRGTTLKEQ